MNRLSLMVVCCSTMATLAAVAGVRVEVSPPEGLAFADAEASTNAALGTAARNLAELRIRVGLESTPTNAVTVAVGCDADGDGTLAPSEADVLFGCDCGTWFVRDAEGFVEELETAAFGRTEREWTIPMRGTAANWNLVRVTRHGAADADESVVLDGTRRHFHIRIR